MSKQAKTKRGTTIEKRNGRLVMVENGEPVSQAVYCDYILRGDWKDRNREFVDSGVQVFHLTQAHGKEVQGLDYFDSALWVDDGVYPDDDHGYAYSLDRQAGDILEMCPDARFFIKFMLSPPLRWTQKYPDQVMTAEDGETFREASWSSERYLRDLSRYVTHFVRFCESREWGDRILGYMALPYGEGCSILTISDHYFDRSAATTVAFRKWLKGRYRTVAALRRAWAQSGVTFATAEVPKDSEWLAKRRDGQATIGGEALAPGGVTSNAGRAAKGLFHWIEAANAVRENDYCHFMREVFQRWVRTVIGGVKGTAAELGVERLMTLDITKQPLMGWQILLNFDGVGDGQSFPNILPLSGSWGVAELLDDDGLDGLWTPADYTARTVGFAYEPEGISDSLVLRNKLMLLENDARCYVGGGIQDQGAFRNEKEVEAGLLRNSALTLSRGYHSYWCNIGSSYFHDKGIHKTVRKVTRMLDRLNTAPHRETSHAIAFVIDDEGPLYEDLSSGYQSLSVIWQRVRGLAHCGVPYRVFLLSDLRRSDFPAYRMFCFPNLFKVDDEVLALLKRKVLRDGNLAIFGPGTGITDGSILTADPASELLGVPMELHPRTTARHVIVQDNGHPISRELPASHVYGDSMPYGPTLVPTEGGVEGAGGVPLGHANACWYIHRTGLFLKESGRGTSGNGKGGARGAGDYGVVWSVALPLPPNLLRACARYAGCNVWCEEDDVIYASDSLVALHSVKAGARVIQLPRACRVTDAVTGRPVGKGKVRQIRLRVDPPQTRVFSLA